MAARTVLVTGATGFIGSRLATALEARGEHVRRMSRLALPGPSAVRADLLDPDALDRACRGVELVFHCAGHAHAFDSPGDTAVRRHRDVNFVGTANLVAAAGRQGVHGFVFLSSVKAMGAPGTALVDEAWPGLPETAYGRAKRDAEHAVLAAGPRFGMRVTNLRLAMVYGSGSRGNLERMARGICRGWFPPLPETEAKRSLVHVDDVLAAMLLVADDARAAGKTYIVADPRSYSGRELYDALRAALGLAPVRWRCPAGVLRVGGEIGHWLGKLRRRPVPLDRAVVERLLGPESYSPALIERELGWRAQVSLQQGLQETFAAGCAAEQAR